MKSHRELMTVLLISKYYHPAELFRTKKCLLDMVLNYDIKVKLLADLRPLGEIHLIAWQISPGL